MVGTLSGKKMFMKPLKTVMLLAALLLPTTAVTSLAQNAAAPDPTQDRLMLSAGFLSAHPDLRYRLLGMEEFKQGRYEDALKFFQRAAFYADKPSQGMVGEMLWNGQGAPKDVALAYAWMDLAAERGYVGFLGLRERYWSALNETERQRAVQEGAALYAKYGDAAAQPRIATTLRRERRKITGSRTGFVGNVQIYVPGPNGFEQIDGSKFFDEKYWDPKQYQAWHDNVWMKPRIGRVSVGDLEQLPAQQPASRIPDAKPDVDATEPETPERNESELGTRKDG
jgi:hypothetical protein